MKGTSIIEAVLFVEANIPKDTPQATEIARVRVILRRVLKV
jgi:hypothetical protein